MFHKTDTSTHNNIYEKHPDKINDVDYLKKSAGFTGELFLGHLRYGTFGKNGIESVHPFLRQNNWMHRNLIVAGNFNMTNVSLLFKNLISLGQHPKEKADTITVMENIGHFLDDAVAKIYKNLKKEGYNKRDASPLIAERMKISKILRKAAKNWDGGYAIAGLLGHGDSFVMRDPAGIRPAYYTENEEIVVVASERPVIQTVFNISFDKIELSCSVDHFGERAEWLRSGTDWGVVENNLLTFRDLDYVTFQMNTVFSMFNYPMIGEFYQYLKDKDIVRTEDWYHSLYLAVHPSYYSAKSLPAELKVSAAENALKFADKFEGDKTSLSRLIRDAVNFAGEDDTWADNKKIMLQHTASIDNIRDEDFWSVFPELNQIRDLEE